MAKGEKLLIGPRIRRLRTSLGLTQARMAEELGISGSYLNLIESNQRAISANVLLRLSDAYDLDLGELTSGTDQQLIGELYDVLRDPALGRDRVPKTEVEDVVGASPATARALVKLHDRFTRLTDRQLREGGPPELRDDDEHIPAQTLVSQYLQEKRNYFDDLDRTAEALADDMRLRRRDTLIALHERMRDKHRIRVRTLPYDLLPDMLRYFDQHSGRLNLSELLPDASRRFQIAVHIGLLEYNDRIEEEIKRSELPPGDARRLMRTTLANYFAGALLMPYGLFLSAAEDLRYDVEALARRFNTSFEQVAHRLTTLSRPDARGLPMFFLRIDRAGNISKRFNPRRFVLPRFGSVCPHWSIHETFAQPDKTLIQVVTLPDGTEYLTISRRVIRAQGTWTQPPQRFAVSIGCEMKRASPMIYYDWIEGQPRPIGAACHHCEQEPCARRTVFTPTDGSARDEHDVRARPLSGL